MIQDNLTTDTYLQLGHVMTSGTPGPVSTLEQIVDATLAEQNLSRNVAVRVSSGMALAETVARTDHIATVPHLGALGYRRFADIQLLDTPFRVTPSM